MGSAVVLAAGSQAVPLGEEIAFWFLAPIAVAGAFGVILLRNAVHSALSLVSTMFAFGAFYLVEQGPFIGFVQIIVYTGAVMMLFLFVLMLVGRDASDSLIETLRGQRVAAGLAGLGFAVLLAVTVAKAVGNVTPVNLHSNTATSSNLIELANLMFTKYLFAFELTSALLIVAAVGAMVLAHVERDGRKRTQKQAARDRIRSGRPQPLPGPGVLSSANSIGTPALLPDGRTSTESVLASTPGVRELPEGLEDLGELQENEL